MELFQLHVFVTPSGRVCPSICQKRVRKSTKNLSGSTISTMRSKGVTIVPGVALSPAPFPQKAMKIAGPVCFICGLLNDAVSSSDDMALDDK
jgi:hypothetical protein